MMIITISRNMSSTFSLVASHLNIFIIILKNIYYYIKKYL